MTDYSNLQNARSSQEVGALIYHKAVSFKLIYSTFITIPIRALTIQDRNLFSYQKKMLLWHIFVTETLCNHLWFDYSLCKPTFFFSLSLTLSQEESLLF